MADRQFHNEKKSVLCPENEACPANADHAVLGRLQLAWMWLQGQRSCSSSPILEEHFGWQEGYLGTLILEFIYVFLAF